MTTCPSPDLPGFVHRRPRPGATRWVGSLFYESATPKLSRLNGIAVAFE